MIDGGLRKAFAIKLPMAHWTSIETGGTGRGIPDSNYCIEGVEGWVEFKLTRARSVDVRPEQVAWIERRVRAGGRVFVAVRRECPAGPRRGPAVDELWLFAGEDVRELATHGLGSGPAPLCVFDGGPRKWDWVKILDKLKK